MHRFSSAAALLSLLAIAACDDSTGPQTALPPNVSHMTVVDSAGSVFRSLNVTLDEPGAVEVFYQATAGGRVLRMAADSVATYHGVLLPRLSEGTTYRFAVRGIGADGATSDSIARGEFTTDSLPASLAGLEYSVSGNSTVPLVVVPFRSGDFIGQVTIETGDGSIVWYTESAGGNLVAVPVPGSHDMLFIENGFPSDGGRNGVVRVNPWRQVVALLESGTNGLGYVHHDVTPLDAERALVIAFDTMTVRDTLVNGEALWEWNMTTGAVEKRWSSWDHIDWDTERNPTAAPTAWLHANSITVGPRGNYVMSFRSLSQVVSITPDFASFEWRVGGPGATVGLSAEDRFIGQHAATEVADGRLLLFDNRGGGPADDRSRALELAIEGDTAYAVWDYTPEPPLLSPVRGGTYRLASGNTMTVFASLPFALRETDPAGDVVWSMTGDIRFTNAFRAAPWAGIAGETVVAAMP